MCNFNNLAYSQYMNNLDTSSQKFTQPVPLATSTESPVWSEGIQEQLDGLPQIWTKSLLYFLAVFTAVILPWTVFSKVDEAGVARGRLEPKEATVRLDSSIAGTVAAVYVKEGQQVIKGQVLLEVESDLLRIDLQQGQLKLEGQENRLVQLQQSRNQLLTAITTQQQQNQAQANEKNAQLDQAKQALIASKTATPFLVSEKLSQVSQAKQSLNAAQTSLIMADSKIQKDLAEVRRYYKLWQQGVIPEVKALEVQRIATESQKLRSQAQADISLARERLKEQEQNYQKLLQQSQSDTKQAESRLKEQQGNQEVLNRSGQLSILKSTSQVEDATGQITTLKADISQTQSQIQSLQTQIKQRIVRSPISGTIFQFPTQKAKAYLQVGQLVAQIAPQNSNLILKAQISNQNSGFLQVGMPVKLKFDAYPFQDYGIVAGTLRWKSPDSRKLESQGQGEVFDLEINLDTTTIQSQSQQIKLAPGQTATAELIIRQRRIIDFILDPFTQLQKGGLKL